MFTCNPHAVAVQLHASYPIRPIGSKNIKIKVFFKDRTSSLSPIHPYPSYPNPFQAITPAAWAASVGFLVANNKRDRLYIVYCGVFQKYCFP